MKQFNYETFKKVLNIMEEQVNKRNIRYDDWEYAFNVYTQGKESIPWNTVALNQLAEVLLKAKVAYLEDKQEKYHNNKKKILKSDLDIKEEPIMINLENMKSNKNEIEFPNIKVSDISIKLPPKSATQQKEILKIIKESAKKVKENKVVEYKKRSSKETLKLINDLLKNSNYLKRKSTTKDYNIINIEYQLLEMFEGLNNLQKDINERIEQEKNKIKSQMIDIRNSIKSNDNVSKITTPKKVKTH